MGLTARAFRRQRRATLPHAGNGDRSDFLIWQQNLGITQTTTAAVVSEPAGILLMLLAIVGLIGRLTNVRAVS